MAWWLTQHLVTVALLAAIVQLTTRVLRGDPGVRHLLWTIVLIKLVLPPVFAWPWSIQTTAASSLAVDNAPTTLRVAAGRAGETAASQYPQTVTPGAAPSDAAALPATDPAPSRNWRALAWFVWLVGTSVFLLLHGVRAWRMRRILEHAGGAGRDLSLRIQAVAAEMRMAPVEIRLAPISSPLVWGGMRPVILWPEALPDSVHPQAVDGLLAHELAHVKRRDHWIGWLELAAGCAWWWNPLFWHVRRQVRANAELACDAWVAEVVPHGRRHFAEALLAFSGGSPALRAPIPAIGVRSGNRRLMERRLAMIMRARVPVRLSRLALCTATLVAALAFPAWAQRPAPAPVPPAPPAPREATSPAPVRQPAPSPREATVIQITPSRARPGTEQSIGVSPVVVETRRGSRTVEVPIETQNVPMDDSDLPVEAQELVRKYGEASVQTRREAEETIARNRAALIDRLQKLQDSEAKEGHLDQALAIRAQIRALQRRTGFTYTYSTGRAVISPDERGFSEGFVIAPPPAPPAPPAPRPAAAPRPPAPPRP